MARTSTAAGPTSTSTTPGPPRRRTALVGVAVVVALGLVVAGFVARQATQPEPRSMDAVVAELSAQHEAEHRAMTEELAATASEVHAEMLPLLAGMHDAMPVEGGEPVGEASPEELEAWTESTATALDDLAGFGLGLTNFNGTRGALRGSVALLDAAARTYGEALAVEEPARARLIALAARQRDEAVELWGVAAEQLDELSIGADLGHIHLFLPATGDPDSVPMEFREPLGLED